MENVYLSRIPFFQDVSPLSLEIGSPTMCESREGREGVLHFEVLNLSTDATTMRRRRSILLLSCL
jgi:hypothetical protein